MREFPTTNFALLVILVLFCRPSLLTDNTHLLCNILLSEGRGALLEIYIVGSAREREFDK
jgi:hypothetical protein